MSKLSEEEIKRKTESIIERSNKINKDFVATEILGWINNNVENFIDNHEKVFKLDLHLPFYVKEMQNAYTLQELFKEIPDDSEAIEVDLTGMGNIDIDQIDKDAAREALGESDDEILKPILECREHLNKIVEDIHKNIQSKEGLKEQIFKKMIYYYELQGIHNGERIVKELEGLVEITEFNYDAFSMNVSVTPKEVRDEEGNVLVEAREAVKYTIPESFSLTLEISFRDKKNTITSMF